jgi:DNA-binding transcriptional regulator LsrR (DeoR family)
MIQTNNPRDRKNLLADIAEMYFVDGKNQAEIAEIIGVTRSNISRMLTEAKSLGIVQIHIIRPLRENHHLAKELINRFDLINARIIDLDNSSQILEMLGKAASKELLSHLKSGFVIGTSWGTAISKTIEELENNTTIQDIKVVQLLGALGARIEDYDAHAIVQRLARKLDADGYYINAPFLVEDKNIVDSLQKNRNIQETLRWGKQADIALLGVGSSDKEFCSFYLADYVTRKEIEEIQNTGAIGDVCGRFYDINGQMTAQAFQNKLIGISLKDLMGIPIRLGVAGGAAKIDPIIGALKGRLINTLVSDVNTISEVLRRT